MPGVTSDPNTYRHAEDQECARDNWQPSVSFAQSCFEPHGPTFELLFVRKFGVLVVERRKLGLVGARGISIRHGDLTEPART